MSSVYFSNPCSKHDLSKHKPVVLKTRTKCSAYLNYCTSIELSYHWDSTSEWIIWLLPQSYNHSYERSNCVL